MEPQTTMYLVYLRIGYIDPSDGCFFSEEKVFSSLRGARRYFLTLQQLAAGREYMNMDPDVSVVLKPVLI